MDGSTDLCKCHQNLHASTYLRTRSYNVYLKRTSIEVFCSSLSFLEDEASGAGLISWKAPKRTTTSLSVKQRRAKYSFSFAARTNWLSRHDGRSDLLVSRSTHPSIRGWFTRTYVQTNNYVPTAFSSRSFVPVLCSRRSGRFDSKQTTTKQTSNEKSEQKCILRKKKRSEENPGKIGFIGTT